jgi:hypothetical protein
MKYNVHIYAIVRVKVLDVEANSQEESIKLVHDHVNLDELLNCKRPQSNIENVEFEDEITGNLVDEHGDEEHERSRFYEAGIEETERE